MMKTLNAALHDNAMLEALYQTVTYLKKLTQLVKQLLPAALQQHCQVANYQQGKLVLQTDNAAWGTQLRYLLPELKHKLRLFPEFSTLQDIRIYIQPPINETVPKHQPLGISNDNAQLMLETAAHIPGKLGAALKKLAARSK